MKRFAALFLAITLLTFQVQGAFTEFYVISTGSNLNAGSTTDNSAELTLTGGDWVQSTGVYTKAASDLSGVSVGEWASVYVDGASIAVFVGRVTAVDDGADTITVSLSAKSGTAPTDGTGNRSIKIGGAWAGPSGTSGFPIGFMEATQTNSAGDVARCNIKAGTYSVTAAITDAINNGARWFEGYTTTPGDGGRAVLDGGTAGNSYIMLTVSGKNCNYVNMTFSNNGSSSGTQREVVSVTGGENVFYRCVFANGRRYGILANAVVTLIECEAYTNNISNTSGTGAIACLTAGTQVINCISHHNLTANTSGFALDQSMLVFGNIAYSNGLHGFETAGDVNQTFLNCSSYGNGSNGFHIANVVSSAHQLINCVAVTNRGYGILVGATSVAASKNGQIRNCAFGSGTMANGLGQINTRFGLPDFGTITLPSGVSPWVDANGGDFRINHSSLKSVGYGGYLQTVQGGGTVAYPDAGAAQSASTNAAAGGGSYSFAQ